MLKTATLARVSFFADLAKEELEGLSACFQRRHYAKGQVIFAQGDPGQSLYIVETGRVAAIASTADGRELVLNRFGPGECFGELALLDGEPRSANAVAQEACSLFLLRRDDFLRFLVEHPSVAIHLLALVSRKLRHTTQQALDVAFLDVPGRLARALLDLARAQGGENVDRRSQAIRVTQSELAEMIGATRESTNRWLSYYTSQGLIDCQRGIVTILSPDGLRKRIY
jgi:CRP/FNR family cyclic AMP-dependent transcriptional regulator